VSTFPSGQDREDREDRQDRQDRQDREDREAPDQVIPHASIVLPCFNEEEHMLLEIERTAGSPPAVG
jgi:hypothetical protein